MSSLEPLSPEEIEAVAQELREAFIASVPYLPSYYDEAAWILSRFVRREEHERVVEDYNELQREHIDTTECFQLAMRERDLLLLDPANRLDGYRELGAKCAALEEDRDKLRERVGKLEAIAREVWESIPAKYGDSDESVQRHAHALNALKAALAACDEEGR